jgi:hypothetical protein
MIAYLTDRWLLILGMIIPLFPVFYGLTINKYLQKKHRVLIVFFILLTLTSIFFEYTSYHGIHNIIYHHLWLPIYLAGYCSFACLSHNDSYSLKKVLSHGIIVFTLTLWLSATLITGWTNYKSLFLFEAISMCLIIGYNLHCFKFFISTIPNSKDYNANTPIYIGIISYISADLSLYSLYLFTEDISHLSFLIYHIMNTVKILTFLAITFSFTQLGKKQIIL